MPANGPLELSLALDVRLGDGRHRQVTVVVGHHVADVALAAQRTLGIGDRLLAELWGHVRGTLTAPELERLANDDAARAEVAAEQERPVGAILARHGYALDGLRITATAVDDDPVVAAARSRADLAAEAAALGEAGLRAHAAFDAAGEWAS